MAPTASGIKSHNKIIKSCWQIIKGVVLYTHRGDNTTNYLEATEMKELAMDITKMNKRGDLAKAELEKMMGCKLDDMTDNQKTIGLAMLVSFESHWNK